MTILSDGPWPAVRDCLVVLGCVTVLDRTDDRLLMTLSSGETAFASWNASTGIVEVSVLDEHPTSTAAANLYYVLLAVTAFPVSLLLSAGRRVLARRAAVEVGPC